MSDTIQQLAYAAPLNFVSNAGAISFTSQNGALQFNTGTGLIPSTVDFTEALLWQYNNAPYLTSLVQQKNTWYQNNHIQFWGQWITNVFDIRTCNQFGLIIWSIILNIPLHVPVPAQANKPTFGFGVLPLGATWNQNFGNGNFAQVSNAVSLSIDQQRLLLRARYFQLTGKFSIPAINRMLKSIFGKFGLIYAEDSLDMSFITYHVKFTPSSSLLFLLTNTNVLPRPAGVGIQIVID